ncbi:hypothetical protein SAMN05443249_5980 [Beijerinckia sp. 28-YEA-48]|nr:hypothetical protein SAMN05443249_5980 [Beijerinckia sp. 28-YEA-48]
MPALPAIRVLALAGIMLVMPVYAQTPTVLDCTGPFARNADEVALAKAFGATNVKRTDIDVGEGFTESGATIFPEDPKRRIEIIWRDKSRHRQPSTIRFRQGSAWSIRLPGSGERRLAIGATLAEVEAANGEPFTILGFDWDNAGYAADWGNGALARPVGGCSLTMLFDADRGASGSALEAVSGDREFRSSDAAIRAVKPVVVRISFEWSE